LAGIQTLPVVAGFIALESVETVERGARKVRVTLWHRTALTLENGLIALRAKCAHTHIAFEAAG
jgi:hypothetical protein